MNIDLSGKRAVISGSTAGIGYAIACGLAGAGAHVILNGRTEGRVDEAVRRLREEVSNASVQGIAADLGTGSAELLDDGSLEIKFACHLGDDAVLKAVRDTSSTAC